MKTKILVPTQLVFVAVFVIDTVIVAVHVHGNDTVGVIGCPLTIRVDLL